MTGNDRIVFELKRRAAAGETAVQIVSWLRSEVGPDVTFFRFASLLFLAFKVPVEAVRSVEEWRGWGANGRMSDEELERALAPLRPRSGPIGE